MIDDMIRALREAGIPVPDDAAKTVEARLRQTYGGERIYIAHLPKQSRAVQMAKLEKRTTSQIAVTCGISRQHAWRLKKLFKPK